MYDGEPCTASKPKLWKHLEPDETNSLKTRNAMSNEPMSNGKYWAGIVILLHVALYYRCFAMLVQTFLDDRLQAMRDIKALCLRPCTYEGFWYDKSQRFDLFVQR